MTKPHNQVLLPLACLAAVCSTSGQDVFDPPPASTATDIPSAAPSSYAAGMDYSEASLPPWFAPIAAPVQQFLNDPLQWGPFRASPHFDYGFLYATRARAGRGGATARHQISPGISLQSRHLFFDYTPRLVYYTKGDLEDYLAHQASVRASYGYGDWIFALSHSYQNSASPNLETASDIKRETHSTSASAVTRLTEKTMLTLGLSQHFRFSGNGNDSKQWSTMNWVDYSLTDKTRIGAGLGGGIAEVELGSDMTYEQVQGRVTWAPTEKLYFALNGGVEVRQYVDIPDSDDQVSPLYGVSALYRLREGTTLTLAGDRSVRTSLLANRAIEVTSISAGVQQRLFSKLGLSVSGSYRLSEYLATGGQQLTAARTDEAIRGRVSLGASFLKRGSISVSYQHVENLSDSSAFALSSDQYGVNIGYSF